MFSKLLTNTLFSTNRFVKSILRKKNRVSFVFCYSPFKAEAENSNLTRGNFTPPLSWNKDTGSIPASRDVKGPASHRIFRVDERSLFTFGPSFLAKQSSVPTLPSALNMSFFNLMVSSALGVSPNELSDLQKAAQPKNKDKNQAKPQPSASTAQAPSASSTSNNDSSIEDRGKGDKETKEAESSVPTYRPKSEAEQDDGGPPGYEDSEADLPRYENVVDGKGKSK
ncbi:hypothetical protein VTL71DRAFT_14681 [Oculimacula yallundae]|uniref:Uncharacterized protein n=1 Tax=Oculimacula yallundae TaxID=86028 RepID=A0ABR4CJ60_9HELO